MRKKIFPIACLVLFLLAGIIALTQEPESFSPGSQEEEGAQETSSGEEAPALSDNEDIADNAPAAEESEAPPKEKPAWARPARWFRSNAAGMPLEEIPSRLAALRNEYALVIDLTEPEELPEHLLPYYEDAYFIETRA
ncbi:MAG: hypothetical protein LBU82_06050, partial [Treponema sp.]|nr:hypothetical protein [Treponema sp.]